MHYYESDIDKKWDRCYKGYYYEMCIQELLTKHKIPFTGNPQLYYEWYKHTNTDYDIMVNGTKIECKLTLTRIYHSWFIRDWYERECDVIVTNYKWHLTIQDREILEQKGTVLLETHQLVNYLEGNK